MKAGKNRMARFELKLREGPLFQEAVFPLFDSDNGCCIVIKR